MVPFGELHDYDAAHVALDAGDTKANGALGAKVQEAIPPYDSLVGATEHSPFVLPYDHLGDRLAAKQGKRRDDV